MSDKVKELKKKYREDAEYLDSNYAFGMSEAFELADDILNELSAHYEQRLAEKDAEIATLKASKLDDTVFIKHIQSHLTKGQEVICKICGETAKDICQRFGTERK